MHLTVIARFQELPQWYSGCEQKGGLSGGRSAAQRQLVVLISVILICWQPAMHCYLLWSCVELGSGICPTRQQGLHVASQLLAIIAKLAGGYELVSIPEVTTHDQETYELQTKKPCTACNPLARRADRSDRASMRISHRRCFRWCPP
jgi:hypothetical protein